MALNLPLKSFDGQNVWLIGASSGIGEACARLIAQKGGNLILSARRIDALQALKNDLISSHGQSSKIEVIPVDVNDQSSIDLAYDDFLKLNISIDVLLFVSGVYQPLRADQFNFSVAENIINTNLLGPMRVLEKILPQFITQKHGHIAIVGSVAGYSGLPKSLAYGPTKAAIINFCESLFYDLNPRGIGVHLISPGFVETPATAGNNFKMPALVTAETAAKEICKGIEVGEFDIHFPKKFSFFLKFLRLLPYPLYFWILKKFLKI
jgi:short-subunit dehydrogenase